MIPAEELSATRGCHCLAARRRARAITRHYEARLRPLGLRATQFSLLAALAQTGPVRLGRLAELLGLERTTLTRNARLLQEQGWIASVATDDARERAMQITDMGLGRLAQALPVWREAQASLEHDIASQHAAAPQMPRGSRGEEERAT